MILFLLKETPMTKRAPNPPLMATPNLFIFIFTFTFLCNSPTINSGSCTLNFTKYPYEVTGDCVDMSAPAETIRTCCGSALRSLFRAMAARTNQSHDQSIFLTPSEARNCSGAFQSLHRSINLSRCGLEDEIAISSSTPDFNDVGHVVNVLGLDRYNNLKFSCSRLSESEYGDEACLDCVVSYREALRVLEESEAMSRRECAKAILVSLSSSDSSSANWVRGTSSCLWSEIELSHGSEIGKRRHHLNSKEVIAMVIVAAAMLVVTPILYQVTKRQLHRSSQKDIEDLSIKVVEDDFTKELPLFSQNKIPKHIENK